MNDIEWMISSPSASLRPLSLNGARRPWSFQGPLVLGRKCREERSRLKLGSGIIFSTNPFLSYGPPLSRYCDCHYFESPNCHGLVENIITTQMGSTNCHVPAIATILRLSSSWEPQIPKAKREIREWSGTLGDASAQSVCTIWWPCVWCCCVVLLYSYQYNFGVGV